MYCINPITISVPQSGLRRWMIVPCGKCNLCCARRKSDLVFRIGETYRASSNCFFITLTYKTECLPEYGTNGKTELQKFIKRMRKNFQLKKYGFKYYAVIELGGDHGRIHHHLLLFNTPWKDVKEVEKALTPTWNKGIVDVKPVTEGRIKYVAKYSFQNQFKPKKRLVVTKYDEETGEILDEAWEKPVNYFQSFSSRGIGIEWLTEKMYKYLRARGDGFCVIDGKERPLPRYYFDKVFPMEEAEIIDSVSYKVRELRKQDNYDRQLDVMYLQHCLEELKQIANGVRDELSETLIDYKNEAERLLRLSEQTGRYNKHYNFTSPPKEAWFKNAKRTKKR